MNVELTIAIEQLRQRPTDRIWFIPILLPGGRVPDRPIGGGETLRDIQWVDIAEDWQGGLNRILSIIRPELDNEVIKKKSETAADLTILMADLVGFSYLVERLGQDSLRELMNCFYVIFRAALKEYDGQAIAFLGDSVLASFRSATKGVRCACTIQREISLYNDSHTGTEIHVRIGLASGPVIQIGKDLYGPTINLASRICSVAKGGEILISDAVRALINIDDLMIRERGAVSLKGLAGTIHLFEVRP